MVVRNGVKYVKEEKFSHDGSLIHERIMQFSKSGEPQQWTINFDDHDGDIVPTRLIGPDYFYKKERNEFYELDSEDFVF